VGSRLSKVRRGAAITVILGEVLPFNTPALEARIRAKVEPIILPAEAPMAPKPAL
jgi:hypothetical protein